ncbi:MAG: glycoside hydrolase family 15 protein [Candidatus Thiodiazotropha sp.]
MKPEVHIDTAPGRPGLAPTWCRSDKDLVGTAIGTSRLWYTLGQGILNEVYYPRIDIPQIRDLGFIVTDERDFWVEVKQLNDYRIDLPEAGIPLPTITHRHPRFTLSLRFCPDPHRDVLLIDLELEGDEALRPYVLLCPHLGGSGRKNLAWVDDYRGHRVLWADQGPFGLALVAVNPDYQSAYGRCSVGYLGVSDAWQQFHRHGRLRDLYRQAGPGNLALSGELKRRSTLALGLATSKEAAATLAKAALTQPFAERVRHQTAAWRQWHTERESRCASPRLPPDLAALFRTSAMVLKSHRDKTFVGAMVASLSVPWGNHGEERGGYHLVWPRDLVESATALLALGDEEEALNVLRYLIATQNVDGHWHQNQWLGGKVHWQGIQLDETAFPVLLAAALEEHDALDGTPVVNMLKRALGFIVREGPASPQDRWEEDDGINTFTLAVTIAALVAGGELLEGRDRDLALKVADYWNHRLEAWTTTSDTALSRRHGIEGYYVREAPSSVMSEADAMSRALPIRNRGQDPQLPAGEQVALDFLQLVRLGLRSPAQPLVRDTVRLTDALLRSETPSGPVWHRYTGDGYGEHPDGAPFDGSGVGRGWPILTGERGHYALAAGEDPMPYLQAMAAMASDRGMLPEQVWESPAVPERGLYPGRPSGSAMPLAWTHSEFVKLAVSRARGRCFDSLDSVVKRYGEGLSDVDLWIWSRHSPLRRLPGGCALLLILNSESTLHLGFDGWRQVRDLDCEALGLGLFGVTLDKALLSGHQSLEFTWREQKSGNWAGVDVRIDLA